MLYPTGAGNSRRLDYGEFAGMSMGAFLGETGAIVVCGNEQKGIATHFYTGTTAGGPLKAFTSAAMGNLVVSPDGSFVIAQILDSGYRRITVSSDNLQTIAGLTSRDEVLRLSPDGKFLWTRQLNIQPVLVERIDVATGARGALLPPCAFPRPGLLEVRHVALADDPHNHVHIERESFSYLFELTTKQ